MRVGTLELSVHILASVIYIGRTLHAPDCIVHVCMAACTVALCTLVVKMFVHIAMCICARVLLHVSYVHQYYVYEYHAHYIA